MWTTVFTGLATLVQQWIIQRGERSKEKHERKKELIRTDNTVLYNLTTGIKDELWTITFLLPIWTILYGAITNQPDIIERVNVGFQALDSILPLEVWSLGVAVSVVVSFGGRVKTLVDALGQRFGLKSGDNT